MLTLLGGASLFLGILLILYTLGVLLYVIPRSVHKYGFIFTGIAGFGLGAGQIFTGIHVIAGALATLELTGLTGVILVALIAKLIPIVGLAGLLYLIIARKYHGNKRKV